MNRSRRIALAGITALLFSDLADADRKAVPQLVLLATYDTGLGAEGSEIISIRHTDGIAALTNVAGA